MVQNFGVAAANEKSKYWGGRWGGHNKGTPKYWVAVALTTPVPTALKVMAQSDIWSVYLILIPEVTFLLLDCFLNSDT